MNSEPASWSEEKQKKLQDFLTGFWAQDDWPVPRKSDGAHLHFRFTCLSTPLNVELKYALWSKFAQGEWKFDRNHGEDCTALTYLIQWLNQVTPNAPSLLVKPLAQWELSLRTYLMQTKRYRQGKTKLLRSTQEYVTYAREDPRILLFRQIYKRIQDAYDDREETEKDLWDIRKLGGRINPTRPRETLATHSASDCVHKISDLHIFSQFLAHDFPALKLRDIDRPLIVRYISYLQERGYSDSRRNRLLVNLRTILTTCAYTLYLEEVTKEDIIFNEDFVKEKLIHPRELPEEVLTQVKQHLNELPTVILRMVVINLSCGLRIGELCTLPLDCIFQDSQGRWYLQLYHSKGNKEHVLPLVDEVVVGTIQAQQEDIKRQGEVTSPFLFPSPRSPKKPYQQVMFATHMNAWAVKNGIRDRNDVLFRFQSHQFRHTVAMGWLHDGVPLDVIRRLLNHGSIKMTERYARRRDEAVRAELEKVHRMRKTVDYQGRIVVGDPRANDLEVQMTRKGIRGQTLPVGG